MTRFSGRRKILVLCLLIVAGVALGTTILWGIITDYSIIGAMHKPVAEHIEQADLLALVQGGESHEAFESAFEAGDEFFETEFNALDGSGANVGDGARFTRVPRADLDGPGQWASHVPRRETGPNAISCNACHIQLFDDGSGSAVGNVHRDPSHTGRLDRFIQRNTPPVFALGALQRLAEEMTEDLKGTRDEAKAAACLQGASGPFPLRAKGIGFGSIKATRVPGSAGCAVAYDTSNVRGVSEDLIVRPFQWKGSVASIRDFNRGAAHNEIGMQPVETTGYGIDGDGDGVKDEVTVGDMTALAVYLAAQPRPTTKIELATLGLIDPLTDDELGAIRRGATVFNAVGCGSCHVPTLKIADPIFREPSRFASYRDATFPAGMNPVAEGVDPRYPVLFDLTRDQPDNQLKDAEGNVGFRLGSFLKDAQGRAVVDLFGDLKRHNMGARLAESIDEVGTGNAMFLTENLWGVGSTAPYLHDGRATTLTEAILEHGGEAIAERDAFRAGPTADQQALCAFLENLVLFKLDEEQQVIVAPASVTLNSALRRRLQRRLR